MSLHGRRLATSTLFAAIALAAIAFAAAKAEFPPSWMLGPVVGKIPAELTAKAEKALTLSTKILGIKTLFSCEKLALDKSFLEVEGKSSGTLLLSGCKAFLNGTENKNCEPKGGGSAKGSITSNALKGQLVLHEGATLEKIEPVTAGGTFATLEVGEACPIGEKVPINGTLYAKESNGKFEVEEEAHLLETGPLTELWATNTNNAEHKATTEGSVRLSLAGENLSKPWSGLGGKPEWMLGPVVGKIPAELTAKAEKALTLSTKILGIKTLFSCEKLALDKSFLEVEGKSSGTLLLSGCKAFLNGTENKNCEPKGGGSAKGSITSNALKGQLVLHEGATLEKIEPVTAGGTFATLEVGEACPIGEKVPINGTLYAKESNGKFEVEEEAHLLETGPLTELWATNTNNAEHKATTEGSVRLSLAGENLSKPWSGLGGKPEWMLGPVVGKIPAELTAKAEKALTLSTKILGIKTLFSCEKLALDKSFLEVEGKSSGTLLLSGCKAFLNGTENKNCEPKGGGSAKGSITSNALKGQLVLHEGATLEKIEPVTAGGTFATLEVGAECPIGEKVPINGTLYAKESNGKFEVEEEAHLLETGPLTELWATNTNNAEHKATTEGSVRLSLAGENLSKPWSGLGA